MVEMRSCAICALLDNDQSLKECEYWKICERWICLQDKENRKRRTSAFMRFRAAGLSQSKRQASSVLSANLPMPKPEL